MASRRVSEQARKETTSMSWPKDRTEEKHRRITVARKRSAYGRRYATEAGAYELAFMIKSLRTLRTIPKRSDSLDQYMRNQMAKTAHYLLTAATISTKSLRLIAKALDAIDAEQREDPRQANIIKAYADCDNYPPTLPEVREKFVAKLDERNWPTDFSIRKTLKSMELPLAKARRGRPRGSRSQIGNRRHVEQ